MHSAVVPSRDPQCILWKLPARKLLSPSLSTGVTEDFPTDSVYVSSYFSFLCAIAWAHLRYMPAKLTMMNYGSRRMLRRDEIGDGMRAKVGERRYWSPVGGLIPYRIKEIVLHPLIRSHSESSNECHFHHRSAITDWYLLNCKILMITLNLSYCRIHVLYIENRSFCRRSGNRSIKCRVAESSK